MRELWLALGLWLFFGLPAGDSPRERSKRTQPAPERAPAAQPAETPRAPAPPQQTPVRTADEPQLAPEAASPAKNDKAARPVPARSAAQVHIGPSAPASVGEPKLAAP